MQTEGIAIGDITTDRRSSMADKSIVGDSDFTDGSSKRQQCYHRDFSEEISSRHLVSRLAATVSRVVADTLATPRCDFDGITCDSGSGPKACMPKIELITEPDRPHSHMFKLAALARITQELANKCARSGRSKSLSSIRPPKSSAKTTAKASAKSTSERTTDAPATLVAGSDDNPKHHQTRDGQTIVKESIHGIADDESVQSSLVMKKTETTKKSSKMSKTKKRCDAGKFKTKKALSKRKKTLSKRKKSVKVSHKKKHKHSHQKKKESDDDTNSDDSDSSDSSSESASSSDSSSSMKSRTRKSSRVLAKRQGHTKKHEKHEKHAKQDGDDGSISGKTAAAAHTIDTCTASASAIGTATVSDTIVATSDSTIGASKKASVGRENVGTTDGALRKVSYIAPSIVAHDLSALPKQQQEKVISPHEKLATIIVNVAKKLNVVSESVEQQTLDMIGGCVVSRLNPELHGGNLLFPTTQKQYLPTVDAADAASAEAVTNACERTAMRVGRLREYRERTVPTFIPECWLSDSTSSVDKHVPSIALPKPFPLCRAIDGVANHLRRVAQQLVENNDVLDAAKQLTLVSRALAELSENVIEATSATVSSVMEYGRRNTRTVGDSSVDISGYAIEYHSAPTRMTKMLYYADVALASLRQATKAEDKQHHQRSSKRQTTPL